MVDPKSLKGAGSSTYTEISKEKIAKKNSSEKSCVTCHLSCVMSHVTCPDELIGMARFVNLKKTIKTQDDKRFYYEQS